MNLKIVKTIVIVTSCLLLILTVLNIQLNLDNYSNTEKDSTNFYNSSQQSERAKVLEVTNANDGQKIQLNILTGEKSGTITDTIVNQEEFGKYKVDDRVVVFEAEDGDFNITDHYRFDKFVIILVFLVIILLLLAGRKGFIALAALVAVFLVLAFYTVPFSLGGSNLLIVSIITSFIISAFIIPVSHGLNKKGVLIGLSVNVVLLITINLLLFVMDFLKLSGSGDESIFFLTASSEIGFSFKGLLFSGMLLSLVGVLDDVVSIQIATIKERINDSRAHTFGELYGAAMRVGREHMVSMINTFILLFAGASFPLFLLTMSTNQGDLAQTLNSEYMMEQLVVGILATIILVIAIPVASIIGSTFMSSTDNVYDSLE